MNIVVNLNKSGGITSQDAVIAVKRAFKVRKAGHTGTLDPMATGVMLVCLNEATKIASLIESLEKEYIATIKLGEATDTYDAEGKVTSTGDPSAITLRDIQERLSHFSGDIEQVPPMYSAIKMQGKPLYKLARKGVEVERKARRVTVSELEILEFNNPTLKIRVACSKGTYIRSICHDLGSALGVGAHMTGLVRTRVGRFRIEDAAVVSELPLKTAALHTADEMLGHLPELLLAPDDYKRACNGNTLKMSVAAGSKGFVRLKDSSGKLFGIGKVDADSIKIERLLFL